MRKKIYSLLFTLTVLFTIEAKNYYVTPTGKASNAGTSYAAAYDIATAITKVAAGDSVILQAGTYTIPFTSGVKNNFVFSKSGLASGKIYFGTNTTGKALIDFSFGPQDWIQDCFGFSVTGSYWYFKNVSITRAGYHGAYVVGNYNTFENCSFYENRNSGLELNKGASYTMVINCDAYKNYDPKKLGSMADGFAPKQTQGPGNTFIGCRAWNNSDDGYDTFDSNEFVTFKNCWAFNNGVDIWKYGGFAGNGNGFKVGGNANLQRNILTNCVAFGQPSKGFDQNSNTGGVTLYNCTSYNNGINYGFGGTLASGEKNIFKNNISLSSTSAISTANANQSNNTWSSGFTVSSADFQSLDLTQASIARNANGSIPTTTLFRLKSTSKLIDAGVDVGLSFNGSKPDLGAFETGTAVVTEAEATQVLDETNEVTVSPNPSANSFTIHTNAKNNFEVYSSNGMVIETVGSNKTFGENYIAGLYFVKDLTNLKIFKIVKN